MMPINIPGKKVKENIYVTCLTLSMIFIVIATIAQGEYVPLTLSQNEFAHAYFPIVSLDVMHSLLLLRFYWYKHFHIFLCRSRKSTFSINPIF